MSESNNLTLQAYEDHVHEYIDGSPQEVTNHVKAWLDQALQYVPMAGEILELGTAHGKDARYIESLGYKVHRTDAVQGFLDYLHNQGLEAKKLNAITDKLGGPYDMIMADAVFLHFTSDEFRTVLQKTYTALKPGGVLAFSVKNGEGTEWSTAKVGVPRFFKYWGNAELSDQLEDFKLLSLELVEDDKWHMVLLQKPA